MTWGRRQSAIIIRKRLSFYWSVIKAAICDQAATTAAIFLLQQQLRKKRKRYRSGSSSHKGNFTADACRQHKREARLEKMKENFHQESKMSARTKRYKRRLEDRRGYELVWTWSSNSPPTTVAAAARKTVDALTKVLDRSGNIKRNIRNDMGDCHPSHGFNGSEPESAGDG